MQHEAGSSQVECMRGYSRRRAEEDEASKLERTTQRMQLQTGIAHEGRITSTGGPTRPRSEATGAPNGAFQKCFKNPGNIHINVVVVTLLLHVPMVFYVFALWSDDE